MRGPTTAAGDSSVHLLQFLLLLLFSASASRFGAKQVSSLAAAAAAAPVKLASSYSRSDHFHGGSLCVYVCVCLLDYIATATLAKFCQVNVMSALVLSRW